VTGSAQDRVLRTTRWLSVAIVPFLVVGFVDLYFWPTRTGSNFAWNIQPSLTPMVLASAYAGGAYFFVRAAAAQRWREIKAGFIPVAMFASLLLVATLLHWSRFIHTHVAFWIWTAVYAVTPFLVVGAWLANRGQDVPVTPDDVLVPRWARVTVGCVGVLAAATGAFLYLLPSRATSVWPWLLTPLTSRVLGAVFLLGIAAVGAFREPRWDCYRLMAQVAAVMIGLIVVAVVRAHSDLDGTRPLGWLFVLGFGAVAVAGAYFAVDQRRQAAG
jgi:hypothetical protein